MRKPFEGVLNVFLFNWHYYAIALLIVVLLYGISFLVPANENLIYSLLLSIIIISLFSIIIAYYIFDRSGIYEFTYLDDLGIGEGSTAATFTAGFDETSIILKSKFKLDNLAIFDFFDAKRHSEMSIRRARKRYKPIPFTQGIDSNNIPMATNSFDIVFVIFAAHEIRNNEERIIFLKELKRIIKPSGKIIMIEHLRDVFNFMAFNLGAFHFYSKENWNQNFKKADLNIVSEFKPNTFITTFILNKNAYSS